MTLGALRGQYPKILVWAALSVGDELPDAQDEIDYFKELDREGLCLVVVKKNQPWDRLAAALLDQAPDIFHFIGHGDRNGSLTFNGRGDETWNLEPSELVAILRAAPNGGPRGVFLNACWSSSQAPHVTPAGGWLVSMDRAAADDVAALFSQHFYTNLLVPSDTPSPSNALRLAQETVRASGAMESELIQSVWLGQNEWLVHDDGEPLTADFVRTVFNRNAFRISAVHELTLDSLRVALTDVSLAIGTGRLVTRENQEVFRLVQLAELHTPEFSRLSRTIGLALHEVNRAVAALAKEYPEFGSSPCLPGSASLDELPRILALMDGVDIGRNRVLSIVNDYLRTQGVTTLAEIPCSSSTDYANYLLSWAE